MHQGGGSGGSHDVLLVVPPVHTGLYHAKRTAAGLHAVFLSWIG